MVATLNTAASNSTTNPAAGIQLLKRSGQTALETGNTAEAILSFGKLVALAPQDPGAHMSLAISLIKAGRKEEGINELEVACGLSPKDIKLWKLLTTAHANNGNLARVEKALQSALAANPTSNELMIQMVEFLTKTGRDFEAIDWFTRILVTTSNELPLLKALADSAQRSGNDQLALVARHRVRALGGKRPELNRLEVVNVEITTYCNLKCTGCCRTVGVANGTWKNKHISLEEFRKIVNDLPETGVLVPYGIGEPMLHPEIFEIIKIAKAANKFGQIMLTSNATMRKIEDFFQLFESGLDRLCVSVDSLDSEVIDLVRPGTDVGKLADRLQIFAAKYPGQVEIRSVVGKNNRNALPTLLARINKLGSFTVYLQPYDDVGNPAGCMTDAERIESLHFLKTCGDLYPNLRIVPQNFEPVRGLCSMPWNAPFITANGDVTPCCRVVNPEVATFGNTLQTTFKELWNSEAAHDWRDSFKARSPEMCKGCPMFVYRGN